MLIVSKHLDYYDGVAKTYLDKTIVYNREEVEVGSGKINPTSELGKMISFYKDIPFTMGYDVKRRRYTQSMEPILIGFCGSFFLFYRYDFILNWGIARSQEQTIEKYREFQRERNYVHLYGFDEKRITNAFLEVGKLKNDRVFIEIDSPVFMIKRDPFSNINQYLVIKNPILKDIGFQKIKDIFTCFQDIQTYLSNILVKREVDTIISDIDLLHSKGYDKYSFRKEKK